MTIWEMMTEDVQKQILNNYEVNDLDDFLGWYGLKRDFESIKVEEIDDYGCLIHRDFIFKVEYRKIIKAYSIYELCVTKEFGDNNELLLVIGHEQTAIINRNTLEEVVSVWTR